MNLPSSSGTVYQSVQNIRDHLFAGYAFYFRLILRLLAALDVFSVFFSLNLHVVIQFDHFLLADIIYLEYVLTLEVDHTVSLS